MYINRELVNQGYAGWREWMHMSDGNSANTLLPVPSSEDCEAPSSLHRCLFPIGTKSTKSKSHRKITLSELVNPVSDEKFPQLFGTDPSTSKTTRAAPTLSNPTRAMTGSPPDMDMEAWKGFFYCVRFVIYSLVTRAFSFCENCLPLLNLSIPWSTRVSFFSFGLPLPTCFFFVLFFLHCYNLYLEGSG